MDPFYHVKQEYHGSSSSNHVANHLPPPQPMEGLNDVGPPPFLSKTYDMVEDSNTHHIVSWHRGGTSFVVWDPHSFSANLLPRYFKHRNFSSFVRQLNTYGFRKIDPERWEFANEAFLMGQKHLLKNIRRRKNTCSHHPLFSHDQQNCNDPCVELGRFGQDGEIDRLQRDKYVLMTELIKLRQQQQTTRDYIQSMEQRLLGAEKKQQQMMSFLARAMQNPSFLQQLIEQKEKRKELEEAMSKKRRRPIDQGRQTLGLVMDSVTVKTEPIELGCHVSELEALALEMQGFGRRKDEQIAAEPVREAEEEKEFDEGFWEELLNNEKVEADIEIPEEEDEDVNVLAESLGYL